MFFSRKSGRVCYYHGGRELRGYATITTRPPINSRVVSNLIMTQLINALKMNKCELQQDTTIIGYVTFLLIKYTCAYVAGWSWECLEDWGPFGRTAFASMVMTFMFWLCTEVGTFLSGRFFCISIL